MPTEPAKTDRVNLEIMGLNELRAMYRQIRDRSEARTPAIFDAAVKSSKPTPKTPLAFVRAAMVARFECRRCAGSGQFVTGTVNGKPVGPGGDCYRCGGLGTQDDADARRNMGTCEWSPDDLTMGTREYLRGLTPAARLNDLLSAGW